MDIEKNIAAGLKRRFNAPNQTAEPFAPDWRGLRARFAAAHAVRRELQRMALERPLRSGGFGLWSTGEMAHSFPGVNLEYSADGRDTAGIKSSSAGDMFASERGMQ